MTKASVRLLAAGAVVAVAAAACGGSSSGGSPNNTSSSGANTASAPGVTATTVTIGSHQPLSGIAAPGYDEIAPASAAYFDWVNAHGGINGRKIIFQKNKDYLNDEYDPTKTVTDVKQLVEQTKVFAIFEGLGTPTHEQVVNFLNQQGVPDLFVASGCLCWNNPSQDPDTFGWLPDYTREGKILGQYVKQHYAGKKIGIFAQDDDFGANGIKGFEDEFPASDIASIQKYDPSAPAAAVTPLVRNLQSAGAQVVISFSVPAFTALLKLNTLQLGFNPQLVVSSVGSDPITLAGLITDFAKQGGATVDGQQLIQGIVTDGYLPSPADASNSWIQLFKKIHDQYIPKLPFDGNVEYGMASAYTFAEALAAAGQNPTRASLIAAVNDQHFAGPNLTPYAYTSTDHSGMTGVQIGVISGLAIHTTGTPLVTDDTTTGAITPYTTAEATAPANGIPTD
jgi:ABC-type branched-subunit amino acid transport system substrate-binding protein